MVNYPDDLDTDAEIPRVEDNITEIGGEAINALREAVFAIEKTIGENPQGSTASLVSRLATALNDDGTLKASALLAAGLVALPITNSQVGATAGIEESKLDLDVATLDLQDQITSNDIDIDNLRGLIDQLLNDFTQHINGTAFKHDSFDILLDSVSPTSTPAAFVGLSAVNVGDALIETNNRFLDHVSTGEIGAHKATNISVVNNFTNFAAADAQEALEELDRLRATEMIQHRDDMHANGFDNFDNSRDGYNTHLQLFPSEFGTSHPGSILSGRRSVFEFDGYSLAGFGVKQGDVLVITSLLAGGSYIIDDVGPRDAVGSKAALDADQVEVVGTFLDGYDGYEVQGAIYGQSSTFTLKGPGAPTIHQSSVRVDSVQLSRPNAARVVSLGINPTLLDSSSSLAFEVGVGSNLTRSITISDLTLDRNGSPASPISVDSVVERINNVLQNRVDGYAFPAAAYRVGDELMLAHNWQNNSNYTLRVLNSGNSNFLLGLDGYGADVVNTTVRPTQTASFYVNGQRRFDYANILIDTATIPGPSSTTLVLDNVDPIAQGVKVGHLLHLKTHSNTDEIGTYFITAVSDSTITIHKSGGITAGSAVQVEVYHDAVPLDDFSTNIRDEIIEVFLDSNGRAGYNERLNYQDSISNMTIVNVSDNFEPLEETLTSTINGTEVSLQFGADATPTILPTAFSGRTKVYSPTNIEYIEVDISSPIGTGSSDVVVNAHINEEELLEVCSVRLNGLLTASNVVDKRLFGHVGTNEVREDYTQAYIETPLAELRSNGIVRGFDLIDGYGLVEPALYPSNEGVLVRGGTVYVGGVRCDVPTTPVLFPSSATGNFFVALNELGTFKIVDENDFSQAELLDGYNGELALVSKVSVSSGIVTSAEDLRFFINDIDNKVELILDLTNHMIGSFASVEAAVNYANNYPSSEKFLIRIVSHTDDAVVIPSNSRDITLEIDGAVGAVTINSDCRIVTRSLNERTDAHISGTLNINNNCLNFVAENVRFGGDVNLAGTTQQKARFENSVFTGANDLNVNGSATSELIIRGCRFDSNHNGVLATDIDQLVVSDTKFEAGVLAVTNSGSQWVVGGCLLDNARINLSGAALVLLDQCRFQNYSAAADLVNLPETAEVSNCIFDNITKTAGEIISSATAIRSCRFTGLDLSGSASILDDGYALVTDCQFGVNTYSVSPVITCNRFAHNTNHSNDAFLVECFEAFVGNSGFHAVDGPSTGTGNLQLVEGNVFPATLGSIGYTLNLTHSNSPADPQIIVRSNTFVGSSGNDVVLCGSATANVDISNNYFNGDGRAIQLANATGPFIISENVFEDIDSIENSAAIDDVKITNNIFDDAPASSLTMGNRFVFSRNTLFSGVITFNGSVSDVQFNENISTPDGSGRFEIDATLFDSTIIGNTGGRIFIGADFTRVNIVSNTCGFNISGSLSFTQVNFTDNMGLFFQSSFPTNEVVWSQSIISENIFTNNSGVSFKIASDGSNTPALVSFSQNFFDQDVTIVSNNEIDQLSFSNNISTDNTKTITFSQHLNNSFISRNLQFGISVADGADRTLIQLNSCGGLDIDLAGTVNNTAIENNFCADIDAACESTGGLRIANNTITGFLGIMNTAGQDYPNFTGATISGNSIVNDINIGTTPLASGTHQFTNSVISGNNCRRIECFRIGDDTATIEFTDNVISNNVADRIGILGIVGNYRSSLVTINNITISSNRVTSGAGIRLNGGSTSAPSFDGPTMTDIVISNNDAAQISVRELVVIDGLMITNNKIASLSFALDPFTAGDDYSNILIMGNDISGDFEIDITTRLDLLDFSFTNNNMLNGDLVIDINSSSGTHNCTGLSICQNNMRAVAGLFSSTATMNFTNLAIANNIFSGDDATTKGVSYEPGFICESSNINASPDITNANFVSNVFASGGELVFRTNGGFMDLTRVNVEGNVLDEVVVDGTANSLELTLTSCRFSNNVIEGGLLIDDVRRVDFLEVSNNYANSITWTPDTRASSSNLLTTIIITNNTCLGDMTLRPTVDGATDATKIEQFWLKDNFVRGDLIIPATADYATGLSTRTAMIMGNYAGDWQSVGAYSAIDERPFYFNLGHGHSTSSISFTGTLDRNQGNSNDLTAATIAPS